MTSFPKHSVCVVIGATGGIGHALISELQQNNYFETVIGLSRSSFPSLELTDEASIAACAQHIQQIGIPRLIIDATGILQSDGIQPEKSWRQLDAVSMMTSFAINAIGPALLMKHLLPLLPKEGKSVFATLSAKVGSIGDNQLGGWYSYRASKAALNQLVHTAAIELKRKQPEAICVALHPGTVHTSLSSPFSKTGLEVQTPATAASRLLTVIEQLSPEQSGTFLNYRGDVLPW